MNFKNLNEFKEFVPLPMCFVGEDGKVIKANKLISEVFLYDAIEGSDIFALTGIKFEVLKNTSDTNSPISIRRNDKVFNLISVNLEDEKGIYLYFNDVTSLVKLEDRYNKEKACIAIINIDNYDELYSSTAVEGQMSMMSEIDKAIRKWASNLEASVVKQREYIYCMIFSYEKCQQEMESKFQILDQIREIESEADFPITLSIGIGIGGKTPEANDDLAQQALDLALGRGGDQAVVKEGNNIYYFGGKTQTVEKSNKGKSRVIGHALKRLIQSSSKVFIMGHKNPDMDSFGAAMGINRLSVPLNRDTYIVLEEYGEALEQLFDEAKQTGNYNIIGRKKAISLIDERSLIIVVDTHKPSITECPELLEYNVRKVIIDHHRKGEEFVDGSTLVYMEPYASSTSELVTEILQYTIDRKELTKFEAEGLLAGIFVDTNHFSSKTGVRTFEAAAWLRRAGADLTNLKRLFQIEKEMFLLRAKGVSEATFYNDEIAFALCEGGKENTQVICSLIADELLTIRGMKMAFAAGKDDKGETVISARSIGEVNVQVIMEEFEGGGHLNAAGAQIYMEPTDIFEKIKKILEEN